MKFYQARIEQDGWNLDAFTGAPAGPRPVRITTRVLFAVQVTHCCSAQKSIYLEDLDAAPEFGPDFDPENEEHAAIREWWETEATEALHKGESGGYYNLDESDFDRVDEDGQPSLFGTDYRPKLGGMFLALGTADEIDEEEYPTDREQWDRARESANGNWEV